MICKSATPSFTILQSSQRKDGNFGVLAAVENSWTNIPHTELPGTRRFQDGWATELLPDLAQLNVLEEDAGRDNGTPG